MVTIKPTSQSKEATQQRVKPDKSLLLQVFSNLS
jgi:hypothetical protein